MGDVEKKKASHRHSYLEENFRSKRRQGLSGLRCFGVFFTVLSILSFGVGVWNIVMICIEGVVWPYVVPIGCIAALLGLVPSCTALNLARCGLGQEESGKVMRNEVKHSIKSQINVLFVSSIYNFVFLLMCCAGAVLGLWMCVDDHDNCQAYREFKMSSSIAVTSLSALLWLASFYYTRWYFVYTRSFGFKSKVERQYRSSKNMELQMRKERQSQQEEQREQQQNNNKEEPQEQTDVNL